MSRPYSSVPAFAFLVSLVLATSRASALPVINEFVADHAGVDTSEFIEIFGAPNTDYSGLRILQIEGDGAAQRGTIDSVIALGSTNAGGFWTTPFLNNQLENGTMTLLLVDGFSGFLTQDLDADNDGVLNITPWTSLLDGIGVRNGGLTDLNYGGVPVLTEGFDGNPFTVGGASRIPNGIDTNSVDDWVRNTFTGVSVSGSADNTPNATNAMPEPATVLLMGTGIVGALSRLRKARRRA